MNGFKNIVNWLKKPAGIILVVVLLLSVVLVVLSYRLATQGSPIQPTPSQVARTTPTIPPTPTPSPTAVPNAPTPTPTPAPIVLPPQNTDQILGVDSSAAPEADKEFPGIRWFRISHPTCGWGDLEGQKLKDTIQNYHRKNIRVLFVVCQSAGRDYTTINFDEIAQAYPDAVQCGNEQMKQAASVSFLYMPPDQYAHFYHLCEKAVRSVRAETPVLMGSLDPNVAGPDEYKMLAQVNYLDQMQAAMGAHRSGWEWRGQAIGVIDTWYNGYRGANNLAGVFNFWAQHFQADRYNLGKHLWVVEGTACFKGCGVDQYNPYEVAVVHILGLITDVRTSLDAKVPFFHFSGKDFVAEVYEPTGLLDLEGRPKPLRQDLGMGERKLTLSCPDGNRPEVQDQLQLAVALYNHCSLPEDYVAILTR